MRRLKRRTRSGEAARSLSSWMRRRGLGWNQPPRSRERLESWTICWRAEEKRAAPRASWAGEGGDVLRTEDGGRSAEDGVLRSENGVVWREEWAAFLLEGDGGGIGRGVGDGGHVLRGEPVGLVFEAAAEGEEDEEHEDGKEDADEGDAEGVGIVGDGGVKEGDALEAINGEGAQGGGEDDAGGDGGAVPPHVAVFAVADFVGEDGFDLLVGEGFEEGVAHEEEAGEGDEAEDGGVGDMVMGAPDEDVLEADMVGAGEGVETRGGVR